jgi:phosphatidate cytidylyltransferase
MFKRTMSALIGAPLLLVFTYLGGPYIAFLVAALTLLALREFLQIGRYMGIKVWHKLAYAAAVIWLASLFMIGRECLLPMLILWLLVCLGKLALTYPSESFPEVSFNFISVLYTVVLLSHLYLLRQLPRGIAWTFLTFFLVWATDTGAYLVGRQFGRHPLAPKISPNKTIEGSLGGLMFSLAVALVFWRLAGGASWDTYLVLGAIVGVSAQVGDLFESALKRGAGIKDSGNLIPGHGGILDRFDSFIFVVPLIYYGVILLT